MPMSRATARSDRLAPSVARWRRATALISAIISARTRARIEAAGIARLLHKYESTALALGQWLCEHRSCPRALLSAKQEHSQVTTEQEPPIRLDDETRPSSTRAQLTIRGRTTMSQHVIVGAGAVGSTTALVLAERGEQVRIVSRRGTGPEHPSIERVAADAGDVARITAAAEGATALYNCVNPLYHRWLTDWPPIASALLGAAEKSGATLVILSNLYGYG